MQTVTHKGLTFGLLYSKSQINEVVMRLAEEINSYYSQLKKDQQIELVIVCVLKGARPSST
jgi:hypoxanthine-guanine phosphoribosyltransferase